MADIRPATPECVAEVADLLRRGGVIIYPTETVYGLGCLADKPEAIERIARLKGSPEGASYLVLLRATEQMQDYAGTVPASAKKLAKRFWPGALTLILPARAGLSPRLLGPSGGIGMRVSSHPWCRELLRHLDQALVSTSANLTGRPAPRSLIEMDQQLSDQADLVVDGGVLAGFASTVVDLCMNPPLVRRAGAITVEAIQQVLGQVIAAK